MNTLSNKIGFWSAILLTLCFVMWIACFTGIALTSPLFYWTNLTDYLAYEHSNSQVLQYCAKFFMLLFGPLYVLIINSFYEYTADTKKVLARISLLFGMGFAILSGIHYFVQLTTVRQSIEQGQFAGLENFVQANPYSAMTSINMLGWTLFLGLSSFFIFPVFTGDRRLRIIRYAFLLNGIFCILAGIGYVFHIDLLTFLSIDLGVGGAVMTATIASIRFFRPLQRV